jgi:hypothetical protein
MSKEDAMVTNISRISDEREGFSARLVTSLQNADCSATSATDLTRNFNIRFSGVPITVHAARKWLIAEAIPTQEKMRVLAEWLGVSAEWLRYGGEERNARPGELTDAIERKNLRMLADMHLLAPHEQQIVRDFVEIMVRRSRKAQADDKQEVA